MPAIREAKHRLKDLEPGTVFMFANEADYYCLWCKGDSEYSDIGSGFYYVVLENGNVYKPKHELDMLVRIFDCELRIK